MNVVVLRGRITSEPRVRELPSGSTVTQLELTTRAHDVALSVPVVVHGAAVTSTAGDEVVVTGRVQRRFFRAGGITQSRTEVVADQVVAASRKRQAERAIERALSHIS